MKTKKIWLSWLYLYILCGVLGFVPEPTGLAKVALITLAACFFVPGFVLIYRADVRDDLQTLQQVRLVSMIAVILSVVLILVNFASALLSRDWGIALNFFFVLFGTPMACGQYWGIALFGWLCLLYYSIYALGKNR